MRFIKDVIRYGVVGVVSSVVDFIVYVGLTRLTQLTVLPANVIAYLAGHLVSFFGNRKWTYRSNGHLGKEYVKFVVVNLVGLGISSGALWVGLMLGHHDLLAKASAVILSGGWNFLMNRYWTFRVRMN